MLKVDKNNNIILTRGDTLTLEIGLTKDGAAYEPAEGDSVRLACSTGYLGQSYYELHFEAEVPTETLVVTVPAETTGALDYGAYNYDVEVTHADGSVDTVISARLTITGEVE